MGGFLGLILGQSVYGVYGIITNRILKVKMQQKVHEKGPLVHRQTQTSIFIGPGAEESVKGVPSAQQQSAEVSEPIRHLDTLV